MRQFKIIVEKHPDGYPAYPLTMPHHLKIKGYGLRAIYGEAGISREEVLEEEDNVL